MCTTTVLDCMGFEFLHMYNVVLSWICDETCRTTPYISHCADAIKLLVSSLYIAGIKMISFYIFIIIVCTSVFETSFKNTILQFAYFCI